MPPGTFTRWRSNLPVERQEPPSGCVSLVISEGAPFRVDVDGRVVTANSFVVGMFDRPAWTAVEGPAWGVQVDLDPAAGLRADRRGGPRLTNRVASLVRSRPRCGSNSRTCGLGPDGRAASAALDEELAAVVGVGPTLSQRVRAAWDLIRSDRRKHRMGGRARRLYRVAPGEAVSRSDRVAPEVGLAPRSLSLCAWAARHRAFPRGHRGARRLRGPGTHDPRVPCLRRRDARPVPYVCSGGDIPSRPTRRWLVPFRP